MSWRYELDPYSQESLRKKAELDLRKRNMPAQSDPTTAAALEAINERAPWLTPQQQIALAKSGASDAAIDRAGELQGRELVSQAQQPTGLMQGIGRAVQYGISSLSFAARMAGKAIDIVPGALDAVNATGDAFYDTVIDPLKPITRYGVAGLDAIPETINNLGSFFVATKSKNKTLGGFWDSLSIATLLDNPELQGEGFVVGDEFRAEQARRARDFRGELNGSAFTVGRGAASVFFTPNSEGYRNASGFIDAIVNVLAPDPTKLVSKTLTGALRTAGEVPTLAREGQLALKAALASEAGVVDNLAGGTVDWIKWNKFMDEQPTARALIDEIVNSDDDLYIMEEIFKYDVSPDMAYSLKNAKSRDEVKSILSEGWVVGDGTLSSNIYDYRNPLRTRVERAPLVNTIRKSRWMRAMPESTIVINGDRFDRTKAVRNMVNSVRSAGANEDEVREIAQIVMPAFRASSTADDQYDAYRAYEATIGMLLKKNGVPKEIVAEILQKPREEMDKIRAWMLNRAGNETDHGFMNAFADMLKDDFPPEFYTDFIEKAGHLGDEVGFARPMQIVELLNRVQTLPDARELRRLTRNPFFADMLKTEAGGTAVRKGGPLGLFTTSKFERREIEVITDQKEYDALTKQIDEIKAASGDSLDETAASKIRDLENERDMLTELVTKRVATGEQKFAYEFIDTLQNAIWKPLALATLGYGIRNSMDAQVRMHFGAGTGIAHPLDYINLVFGRTGKRSILGEDLLGKDLNSLRKGHKDILVTSSRKQGITTTEFAGNLKNTNVWVPVSRQGGFAKHTNGMIQQGRLVFNDPLQNIAARGLSLGKTEDEIVEMLVKAAREPETYAEIRGIFKRGIPYVDMNGAKVVSPSVDFDMMSKARVDEYIRLHAKTVVLGNVKNHTGNLDDVQFMYAFNRVPMMDQAKVIPVKDLGFKPIEGKVVSVDGQEGVITRIADNKVTFIPVHEGEAFKGAYGSRQARRLIDSKPIWDEKVGRGLPERVAKEVYRRAKEDKSWFKATEEAMDKMVDKLFTDLYGNKYVKATEKSPTFRKFYYDTVAQNLDRLDPESAKKVMKSLRDNAKLEGVSVGKYIGDDAIAKRIEDIASKGGKGNISAEDLDDYARFLAIQKTKRLLYDASERSNLEDIMRIIAPFAGAWRDIVGTYMGFTATENVRALRSFQRIYTGAKYADPDQDGRGFVYEDPQTGQMMFAFPFSRGIASMVQNVIPGGGTAVQSILEAPVKQLSQGINVFPAIGPMAQVAASELIPDVPKYNTITELLLPYGKKDYSTLFNPTPGWLNKAAQVLQADTKNTTTAYFNTYSEVLRAKQATGNYDLSREEEMQRLQADAKWDARWLTALRAISQFVGPTAGTTEFIVPTKQGDAFVGEIIKEFQKLQQDDYDTSVTRFLELYGENMSLYVSSKSRSVVNGLEASPEFGDWQREHPDVLKQYDRVGAYFSPYGSDFSFSVWNAQLQRGERVKLTDTEMIKLAQERIGAAKYRRARRLFGPYPNERQSAILALYRQKLHQEHPGFPRYAEFVTNQFANDIENLKALVEDSRVADSKVVAPLIQYLEQRDLALARVGTKTLQSKKAQGARGSLYQFGEALAAQSPEFDRIWGRLLAQEVED
jgi:hypothetical protein